MIALIVRDIRLGVRAGGGALIGILFYLAVVAVTPFAFGPDLNLLSRIGPAILWVGALLASLLGLERLFRIDHEDGALDVLVMSRFETPLALTVFGKCVAHWLVTGLPLVIVTPLLGLLLNMEIAAIGATALTLLVGTPAITFIGAAGAAVAVALPRGGLLVSVIILPFTIPVLIFGVMASYGAVEDPAPFVQPFAFLAALTLFFAVLGPFAAAVALKGLQD
ncbi:MULTISPECIES: heme exporter protein CcmB [unclassified Roseitalea]|uniref:heme exporter protein CcmB n=1 Tax=unclassified Roseitalea TaxID=2639107 RepID=UPI00273D00BE|nr:MULTISPECIES: heme exporter protein CcmB [unclassified Roseitalea]